MKTKIADALKTKYKNLGFGDKAIDGVADFLSKSVTKEEEIEATATGAEALLKAFQGDIDKRVNDAITAAKAKWQDDHKPEPPKTDPAPKPTGDEPEWLKSFKAEMAEIKTELKGFKQDHVMQGQHTRIKAKLNEAKVPEIYYTKLMAGKAFKDDAEIEQFTTELVTGWEEVRQNLADEGLGQAHKPIMGAQQKDGVSQRVKDYLEAKANPDKGGDNLGGKKL